MKSGGLEKLKPPHIEGAVGGCEPGARAAYEKWLVSILGFLGFLNLSGDFFLVGHGL